MKKIYRRFLGFLNHLSGNVNTVKTWVLEWYEILRKRKLYMDIRWTPEQQKAFDDFWLENYGRRISSRWHKLYQSFNRVFNPTYIPEILYTVGFEPRGNDCVYTSVLQDKAYVEAFTGGTDVVVPETIAAQSGGLYRDSRYNVITKQDVMTRLKAAGDIVIKPTVGGSSGRGVQFFNTVADMPTIEQVLQQLDGTEHIIQRAIRQHPVFAALHAGSVNTIRMITYICGDEICCAPICMRIGQGDSHLDNIHAGGIVIGVTSDGKLLETGYQLGWNDQRIVMQEHPDSKIKFAGYQLPKIPQMIEQAKKIHAHFTHIRFVSFDFTVDEDENIVLIESNLQSQGMWFPQIIHGQSLFGKNADVMLQEYKGKRFRPL